MMELHYPNGKKFIKKNEHSYISPTINKDIHYGNRGMTLEADLNESNQYYLVHGIAVIHKKPTPVQIVSVDYQSRSKAVIKEAYFRQASTTDYNGICDGKYIDFEAKETKSNTSFPLRNFHQHQIDHMIAVQDQLGITFVILRFSQIDEIYLLEGKHLFYFWERMQNGGRKSISKQEVENYGYHIKYGLTPRIDYISIIRQLGLL